MRFGDWTPYPESRMGMAFPRYTVCEVIRQIYKKSDDPEIKLKCRIAISMTKAMDEKLREYSALYGNSFWVSETREVNQEVQDYLEQH